MKSTIYYLHTISGLHVGTGQGIGVIDMPIARERATNLPQVPGSGIKGVLRDELNPEHQEDDKKIDENDYKALFGPKPSEKASEFAGALAVGDARLLCLPIRSWKGTFAWVTCPMILERYKRDLNIDKPTSFDFGENDENAFHYADESNSDDVSTKLKEGNNIYLEDLDLVAQQGAKDWADLIAPKIFQDDEWQTLFKQRFLIVSDNVFDFLSETATEIRARIKIEDNTRTVKSGALWYEEYLPAETLMWGVIASDNARNGLKEKPGKDATALLKILPTNERLQIGGNATVGAGQVRWIMGGV